MSWTIDLPLRDRDEPLDVDALTDLPGNLGTGGDQRVAREILIAARLDGARTVGDVHDRIEAMSGPERRELLDRVRQQAITTMPSEAPPRRRSSAAWKAGRSTLPPE